MSEDQATPEPVDVADEPMDEPSEEPTDEPMDEPIRTGVERVDAVVDEVAGLADRPVDEHVAVYESAHDELRRTLDSQSDDAE